MRTTLDIAKNELKTLFFSPVAWLIVIVFAFQTGFEFSRLFDYAVQTKAAGGGLSDLTQRIFSSTLVKIQGYLYLYIPLLTMGLMSREYYNGSFKLLYSSPVRNSRIIAGKYLAVLVYALVLMAVAGLFIVFGTVTVKELDVPCLLSGLLGLFLLTCSYCAIGLFMSSLTSYQIVAAIATFAALTLLNLIGTMWQDVPVVNDIAYWLSIKGRSNQMISGLITSEDVLYFAIVSGLFVSFAIFWLQDKRTGAPLVRRLPRYAAAAIIAMAAGYITTIPVLKFSHDATAGKTRTLMPQAQRILEMSDDRVTLTAWVNLFGANAELGLPATNNRMEEYLADYLRFKPRMKIRHVYYYMPTSEHAKLEARYPAANDAERARDMARLLGVSIKKFLTPEQIAGIRDFSAGDWGLVWELEDSQGHRETIRTSREAGWPGRVEITTAFGRLAGMTVNTAMLTEHGERSATGARSHDYSGALTVRRSRSSFANLGFDFTDIDLSQMGAMPDGTDLLVIADPRQPLPGGQLSAIASFINSGGNMMILGDPDGRQYINPVLELVGMELSPGKLVQPTGDYDQTLIQGNPTEEIARWNPARFAWMSRWSIKHAMTGAAEVRKIADLGFETIPIIATDPTGCWNESETTDLYEKQAVLNPSAGEHEGIRYVAHALERNVPGRERSQRIVVFGDADWLSNNDYTMRKQGINIDNSVITEAVFRWLSHGDYPVLKESERSPGGDNDILHINPDRMPLINVLLTALLPAVLALLFGAIVISRKNK